MLLYATAKGKSRLHIVKDLHSQAKCGSIRLEAGKQGYLNPPRDLHGAVICGRCQRDQRFRIRVVRKTDPDNATSPSP
jgi:hypothetical protein